MGSMPHGTFHETESERAEDALQEARLNFFKELDVDLHAVLEGYAQANRDAAKSCEEDGDEYNLKEWYHNAAAHFEKLATGATGPLPSDPAEQMEVYADATGTYTEEGCGNILDFNGIPSSGDGIYQMRPMSEGEIEEAFGSRKPTRADIEAGWPRLWGDLDRATGICCRFYDSDRPKGWWFLGATAD